MKKLLAFAIANVETGFCPRASLLHATEGATDVFLPISEIDPNSDTLEKTDNDLYAWGELIEYNMNTESKYGVQFNSKVDFDGFEFFVCTVPKGDNSVTLELYKWNKNYSTTVKDEPIVSKALKNVNPNNWARLEGNFEAGEYLAVVKNGTDGMKVGVVEASAENVNHYLHTSKAGVSLISRIIGEKKLAAPTAPEAQEFISNDASTWVGTDGLDRVLPTFDTTGGIREDKFVGIFYHTWHSAFAYRSVVNVTELLEKYPEAKNDYDHAAWNGETNCFWNEPIWGYYNNGVDRWVLRKQAEMLADAGVDVVFFDNTNGAMNFVDAIMTLCEVWAEARADGVKTPQISAMLNMYDYGDTATQIKELYDKIYSKGLYQDLWFYWEGKPLLLGYPERLKGLDGGKEAYNFFSYRPINTGYTENADLILEHTDANGNKVNRVGYSYPNNTRGYTFWKWISVYPQEKMYYQRRTSSFVEEMCVCVAQNWSAKQGLTPMNGGDDVFGRGYTNEFGPNTSIEAAQHGLNFAEQWNYALEVDPKFIYITGWNEWQVGRTLETWGYENGLPDNATDGYSRDVEPSTGALKDHFYNQMVSFIRKFKGSNTQTPSSGVVSNLESINWDAVAPVYRAYAGNTLHRDYDGYKGYHYTNTTGRNDFVESRVTYDKENVYFMVKTAEDITPYTDPAWMRLLIDMVGVEETDANNWETFEYIVNRTTPTDSKAVLERSTGGWNWEKVADVDYTVNGDTMIVTISRAALGISADAETFSLNFKWSDNMQKDGDVMDFYVSGDVAPGARFKYSFTSVGDEVIVVGGDETTAVEETTASVETEAPAIDTDDTASVETEAPSVEETTVAEAEGCKSSMIGGGAAVASAVALAGYALAKKKKED